MDTQITWICTVAGLSGQDGTAAQITAARSPALLIELNSEANFPHLLELPGISGGIVRGASAQA
jgi:hypothetical protein